MNENIIEKGVLLDFYIYVMEYVFDFEYEYINYVFVY